MNRVATINEDSGGSNGRGIGVNKGERIDELSHCPVKSSLEAVSGRRRCY
jgi:hypothetical protein